jgi:Anti-sigma-K factor rskA
MDTMPTDRSRIELPPWLPWATTACLAALVACLGELWIIEKTRSQLLREQAMLAEAATKGAQNQLEAERIVNGREISRLRAAPAPQAGLELALLLPQEGANLPAPAFGVVAWDRAGRRALIRLHGMPAQAPARDYQLWLVAPGPGSPVECAVFHAPADDGGAGNLISMPDGVAHGCRFILVDAPRGGVRTLDGAQAGASIVLATLPLAENISGR